MTRVFKSLGKLPTEERPDLLPQKIQKNGNCTGWILNMLERSGQEHPLFSYHGTGPQGHCMKLDSCSERYYLGLIGEVILTFENPCHKFNCNKVLRGGEDGLQQQSLQKPNS